MTPICVGCKREMDSEKIGRVVVLKRRPQSWWVQHGDEYVCGGCGVSIVVMHAQTRPRWTRDEREVEGAVDISE